MMRDFSVHWLTLEQVVSWLVLTILLAFTYALFFRVPYPGFEFSNGRVFSVHVTSTLNDSLQIGDQFIQIGNVSWKDFRNNLREVLFNGVKPGQSVPLHILRNGQELTIDWIFTGPTRSAVTERLSSNWWLAYVFWLAGLVTVLFLRPRDSRQRLLFTFFFLTAIWLAAGSGPSHWHTWGSAIVLRSVIWLCVPVYWHLHWSLPKPLGHLPEAIIWGGYLIGLILAALQVLQILPPTAYYFAFVLAMGISLAILIVRVILRPSQRRDIRLIWAAIVIALVPSLILGFTEIIAPTPPLATTLALITLPAFPGAYLYTAYRQRAGGLELRVNHILSLYLFVILLSTSVILLVALVKAYYEFPNLNLLMGVAIAVLVAMVTILIFPIFQRFVERELLGMPLPPTKLLETYTSRITTSLDVPSLVDLLKNEIFPSLLVRQSALLRLDDGDHLAPLYISEGVEDQLPGDGYIPTLLARSGMYLSDLEPDDDPQLFRWLRLILPLTIGEKLIGFILLGRRDPDDLYLQNEIPILQSIANLTAISLVNIAQANRLHALYRANIEQHDIERTNLARDLHDVVLNRLALLSMNVNTRDFLPNYRENVQAVITCTRQIISGLRPVMLNYGLWAALEEFADEIYERENNDVVVEMVLPPSEERYEPNIEEHLYRIVEQAGENALKHANAKTIKIDGMLEAGGVKLIIEDDGAGFADLELLDFNKLLASKHFGLVGMHERAALIGADLQILTAPGKGTKVFVSWGSQDSSRYSPDIDDSRSSNR